MAFDPVTELIQNVVNSVKNGDREVDVKKNGSRAESRLWVGNVKSVSVCQHAQWLASDSCNAIMMLRQVVWHAMALWQFQCFVIICGQSRQFMVESALQLDDWGFSEFLYLQRVYTCLHSYCYSPAHAVYLCLPSHNTSCIKSRNWCRLRTIWTLSFEKRHI